MGTQPTRESENWHKELKLGFGMEQLPCGQFAANALFFAIGVSAYNLSVLLKAEVLPEEYRHSTVQTLRWQLYRLAAKFSAARTAMDPEGTH